MSDSLTVSPSMQPLVSSMRASALAALSLVAVLSSGFVQAQGLRVSPSLSLGRAPSNAQQTADYIVAIVNTEPITNNEVRSRVLQLEQQALSRGGNIPPRSAHGRGARSHHQRTRTGSIGQRQWL